MGFLEWLEAGALGVFVRESLWGYPITLSSHAVGMAVVVGVVVALNMRVLGFARGISIQAFDRIFLVGWLGFLLNLVSGIVLFAGSATDYITQGAFQLKLFGIIVGGILMKVVMNAVREGKDQKLVKSYSAACLACWGLAVVTGRLMAYV